MGNVFLIIVHGVADKLMLMEFLAHTIESDQQDYKSHWEQCKRAVIIGMVLGTQQHHLQKGKSEMVYSLSEAFDADFLSLI